jgi:AcrR family transcriptional regulator
MVELSASPSHGQRRRASILEAAADVSTAEGLEGLSIGRLAREVGMSKSGVAGHFESKQALQLATIEAVASDYDDRILARPRAAEPGLPRLRRMLEAWIGHIDGISYRGGCFFAAAGNEFAARSGQIRVRIAHYTKVWIDALEAEALLAVRLGELRPEVDVRRLVFKLHGFVQEANLRWRLLEEEAAFDDARVLVAECLASNSVIVFDSTHP